MPNRTWITDNKFEVTALTEGNFLSEIGAEGDVTGWWKAEDFTTEQWVADKTSGDDEYYITQWDDSSGNSNHLIDPWLGGGPQAYGTGTNEHGSSADEINGYSVLRFQASFNSGGNVKDLKLLCLPSNTVDFGIKVNTTDDDPQHIMWVIISKPDSLSATWDNPVVGNEFLGHDGSTSWDISRTYAMAFDKHPISGNVYFGVSHSSGGASGDLCAADDWNITCSCAYDEITDGSYVGQGMYATTNINSHVIPNPNYAWCVDCAPNGNSAGDFGTLQSGSASGTVYLSVGTSNDDDATGGAGIYPAVRTFEGRIAEMVCIKSDAPISTYLRARIIEYFKTKFDR